MSAPTVVAVTPTDQETDVVLGTQITVLFSTLMDHSTINDGTFSLQGPGQTMVVTPDQAIAIDPEPVAGREYILGTLSFDDTFGGGTQTLVTFNPSKSLQPDLQYTVLILGSGGVLSSDSVKDSLGNPMVGSYQWTFTTGQLHLVVPPPSAPVPGASPLLDPSKIVVIPRVGTDYAQTSNQRVGADLTQYIDIIFPDSVSLTPYDPTPDILTSIEAIVGDPLVMVPTGLTVTPTWGAYGGKANRKLTLAITGWPIQ